MPAAGTGDVTAIVPVNTVQVGSVTVATGVTGTGGAALMVTSTSKEIHVPLS